MENKKDFSLGEVLAEGYKRHTPMSGHRSYITTTTSELLGFDNEREKRFGLYFEHITNDKTLEDLSNILKGNTYDNFSEKNSLFNDDIKDLLKYMPEDHLKETLSAIQKTNPEIYNSIKMEVENNTDPEFSSNLRNNMPSIDEFDYAPAQSLLGSRVKSSNKIDAGPERTKRSMISFKNK